MRPLSLALIALTAFATSSCELLKPKDQSAGYDPYGAQTNPYGQAAANPYGQAPAASTNPYGAVPGSNPYGSAPAANANPYGSYETPQPYTAPSNNNSYTPPASTGGGGGGGGSVTVKSGDTLTSIARRNNTSVSALKSANGLTSDLIRIGQKLNLP